MCEYLESNGVAFLTQLDLETIGTYNSSTAPLLTPTSMLSPHLPSSHLISPHLTASHGISARLSPSNPQCKTVRTILLPSLLFPSLHVTPHTSCNTPDISHLPPHTLHFAQHTFHPTPHTAHSTLHTPHLTPNRNSEDSRLPDSRRPLH